MTYFLPMGEKVKYKRKIRQKQIWVVTSRSDKRNYKGKKNNQFHYTKLQTAVLKKSVCWWKNTAKETKNQLEKNIHSK